MRPSNKSRSRNKNNNRRSVGNIINRVFDSSGPEGKVRGTPQQIIDKYVALSRDATLSGDRVAAENFAQHAEHYLRMMGEATREQQERRDEQEGQGRSGRDGDDGGESSSRDHGGERSDTRSRDHGGERSDTRDRDHGGERSDTRDRDHGGERGDTRDRNHGGERGDEARPQAEDAPRPASDAPRPRTRRAPKGSAPVETSESAQPAAPQENAESPLDEVIDLGTDGESGLVETPESKPAPRRRAPRSRSRETSRAAE
ncbi:MAG: DUF4167 domain-containing protein [Rhodobacteraceae bacterium]|nr:DUF4167 domain-containing protein [Paracoccaceae bacterium]